MIIINGKKVLLSVLTVLLLVSLSMTSFAKQQDFNESREINPEKASLDYELNGISDVIQSEDGNLEIIPHDVEQFLELTGVEKPSEDAELLKIIRVTNQNKVGLNNNNEEQSPSPLASLRVVSTGTSEGTHWDRIARSRVMCGVPSGCSALNVSISKTEGFTSDFEANIGISKSIVSAGVGFSIGTSTNTTVQGGATEAVDYNRYLVLDAYPRISITGFDIEELSWFTWSKIGSGSAWRVVPNEIDFFVWIQ